jgi:hypothetical protein
MAIRATMLVFAAACTSAEVHRDVTYDDRLVIADAD